jgi:putative membrane protein
MQTFSKTERLTLFLLVPFYLIGVVLHLVNATFPLMLVLTPFSILGTSILGFWFEAKAKNVPLLVWALGTFLVTLPLEIVGVATSLIFGAYTYGPTLGLSVLGVPLLIGINWTIIILGLVEIVGDHVQSKPLVALVTATLTVVFDYVMEPVAIAFDYWTWTGGDIPLQNYIAWFCIAFLFAYLYQHYRLKTTNRVPTLIVIVQFVFFLLLRLFAL